MDGSALLVNLAFALVAATVGGAVAIRLGQSTIIGFILAGVAIGPFTPGFVGDREIVDALADIGVIFLMFAIGVQISIRDLLRAGPVAGIGGLLQVGLMIGVGYGVGVAMGWGQLESVFFGAVISNSSSTVMAKVLGERGESDTDHAHVALAWSTIQDLSTIVLIVMLTAVASTGGVGPALGPAIGSALLFLVLLVPLGLRVVPFAFELLAATRSREIFVLGVVAMALGTAFAASLFGISLALGAFLAGLVVGESDLSHRVLGETLPFRDLFAGLFFVSIGMLVDPAFVVVNLPAVLVVAALIVPVKGAISAILTRAFRYSFRTSVLAGVALAQSAEFSFLLARLGSDLGVVSPAVFSLMLTGAAASIVLSAPLHQGAGRAVRRVEQRLGQASPPISPLLDDGDDGRRVAVICGYGRVGRMIGRTLERRGFRFVVIEDDGRVVDELRARGIPVVRGLADNPIVLEQAGLQRAAVLAVAVPDPMAVRLIVDEARRTHPRLAIVARSHSAPERDVLRALGVDEVVVGETELGLEMTRFTLRRLGVSATEAASVIQGLRR